MRMVYLWHSHQELTPQTTLDKIAPILYVMV